MSTLAGQQAIVDVQTFLAWTDAVASDDTKLAVFLRSRFRPEFLVAFDAWLGRPPGTTVSTDEIPPGTPFDTYRPAAFAASLDVLSDEASAAFEEAKVDNQRSDNYVLTTVLLAGVLFFAGVGPRFRSRAIGAGLVGLACVLMAVGAVALLAQPVSFSL